MPLLHKHFSSDKYVIHYLVDEHQSGMRLDRFLQTFFKSFSREIVKQKIKRGEIKIKNRPGVHRSSTTVHHKEVVKMTTFKGPHEDEYWNNKKLKLQTQPKILFEDTKIIVISKPPFMSTHPTGKHLFNCATVYLETLYKNTIHSVHRLDRETSGLLLFAKDPGTARQLSKHFEYGHVKKCYFFISTINDFYSGQEKFIAEEKHDNSQKSLKRVYVKHYPKDAQQGKSSLTKFHILTQISTQDKQYHRYALGLAFPKTGRQHQIRIHAMIHGLPLLGDKLYLGNFETFQRFKDNVATRADHEVMKIPRHALHAIALKIPYGEGKRARFFRCCISEDLKDCMKKNLELNAMQIEKIEREIDKIIRKEFSLSFST